MERRLLGVHEESLSLLEHSRREAATNLPRWRWRLMVVVAVNKVEEECCTSSRCEGLRAPSLLYSSSTLGRAASSFSSERVARTCRKPEGR